MVKWVKLLFSIKQIVICYNVGIGALVLNPISAWYLPLSCLKQVIVYVMVFFFPSMDTASSLLQKWSWWIPQIRSAEQLKLNHNDLTLMPPTYMTTLALSLSLHQVWLQNDKLLISWMKNSFNMFIKSYL